MSKCKIYVSKDRKNFFWTVIDRQKLILNPTEEDLKTKSISYNKTNICPRCREDEEINGKELTDKSILYPGNVLHDTDKNGKKVNEWVCRIHGLKHRNKYNPNGNYNLKKLLGNRRTHNQHPDDRNAFGDDCQECTCL